jgi:hypothetical protein
MLIAEYYTWAKGPWALLQIATLRDGHRFYHEEVIIPKGKRAARAEAERRGAKPWNF